RYAPARTTQQIAAEQWWRGSSTPLPAFRTDLRNREEHPLNLQFAGSLEWLSQQLSTVGWTTATHLNGADWIRLLSPKQSLQALPVLPQVHDGRHEALLLSKPLPDDRRLVLRLWATDFLLTGTTTPLWIGNISEQRQVTVLDLLTYAQTAKNFDQTLDQLRSDLRTLPDGSVRDEGTLLKVRQPADPHN
ncbi:MAG: LssY C-terminal domain-containing protein, partial [Sedimenticola sp.]|nr:LssY C-terminal domain-containing protein [Sedimenticola sp.]